MSPSLKTEFVLSSRIVISPDAAPEPELSGALSVWFPPVGFTHPPRARAPAVRPPSAKSERRVREAVLEVVISSSPFN